MRTDTGIHETTLKARARCNHCNGSLLPDERVVTDGTRVWCDYNCQAGNRTVERGQEEI